MECMKCKFVVHPIVRLTVLALVHIENVAQEKVCKPLLFYSFSYSARDYFNDGTDENFSSFRRCF